MSAKTKQYTNQDIAQLLKNIAAAYTIKKKNRFRTTAYQDAADSIINYPQSIQQLWQKNPKLLDQIPGIGPNILEKLDYLFTHHQNHPHIVRAFKNIHPAVFEFIKINGVGPKTAHQLTQKLKFPRQPQAAIVKLITYAQNGKIQKFPRFGKKSEKQILKNAKNYLKSYHRLPLVSAQKIAQQIISYLKTKFPRTQFVPLGSLRRQAPTVGDIDIAAKSTKTKTIIDHFVSYPDKIQTLNRGPKKASIKIKGNIRLDLMVQPSSSFGSLLQHFTGSKQHNILLRKHAQNLGYSLSEYGIKDLKTQKLHKFSSEKDFYHFLRLAYIPPQKRLGENEIKQAARWYTNKR